MAANLRQLYQDDCSRDPRLNGSISSASSQKWLHIREQTGDLHSSRLLLNLNDITLHKHKERAKAKASRAAARVRYAAADAAQHGWQMRKARRSHAIRVPFSAAHQPQSGSWLKLASIDSRCFSARDTRGPPNGHGHWLAAARRAMRKMRAMWMIGRRLLPIFWTDPIWVPPCHSFQVDPRGGQTGKVPRKFSCSDHSHRSQALGDCATQFSRTAPHCTALCHLRVLYGSCPLSHRRASGVWRLVSGGVQGGSLRPLIALGSEQACSRRRALQVATLLLPRRASPAPM